MQIWNRSREGRPKPVTGQDRKPQDTNRLWGGIQTTRNTPPLRIQGRVGEQTPKNIAIKSDIRMNKIPPIESHSTPPGKARQDPRTLRSAPLDKRLWSASPAVLAMASGLVDEVSTAGIKKRPIRTALHKDMRRFFVCLLVNFFDAWVTDPSAHLAVKLGKEDYHGSGFTYAAVKNGMRGLEALGYVYRAGHHWDPVKLRGYVTRFKATAKLVALLAPLDLSVIQVHERSPLVEIRPSGKDRRWAAKRNDVYPAPRWPADERGAKAKMVKNLRILNAALRNQFQALALPDDVLQSALGRNKRPVKLRRQALHRVFTIDPHHGGRFVGPWWQSIKKELREHIRMAAPGQTPQETVELDFDSMHPAMLYAARKFPVKGDLYAIWPDSPQKNKALRQLVKQLMLTLINSDSPNDAKNSFKEYVNTEAYPDWLRKEWDTEEKVIRYANIDGKLAEMYPGCPSLDKLVKDITSHHSRIAESFGSGAGRWLMFEDSQISEMVMLTMWGEHEIVPLPNHDSFIVPRQYESALRITMERVFASRFAGITPGITRKPHSAKPHELDDSHLYSKLLKQWRATAAQPLHRTPVFSAHNLDPQLTKEIEHMSSASDFANQAYVDGQRRVAAYIADSNANMAAETAKAAAAARNAPAVIPEDPTAQLNSLAAAQRAAVTPANQRYGVNPGEFGSIGAVDGYGE